MHFYSAQPAYTQIKCSNTLKSVSFLTPDLLSAALQEFLLLGLSSPSRGGQQLPRVEGLLTPRGAGAKLWGRSPFLLLLVPGIRLNLMAALSA